MWSLCSAYTSNGIVDFLKEVQTSLPESIENVFFRADSGFFSGKLKILERLLQKLSGEDLKWK